MTFLKIICGYYMEAPLFFPEPTNTASCSNNKTVQQAESPVNYCNPGALRVLLVVGVLWSLQTVIILKFRYCLFLNVFLSR